MITTDQIAQLIMKVEPAFSAQLEFSQKKQQQNEGGSSPQLRSITPGPITTPPLPPGIERDSPLGHWHASFFNLVASGQNLTSTTSEQIKRELASVRAKAQSLKNEYRACFMAMTGDTSPEQANAIYTYAQTKANAAFKAAHTAQDGDAYQIAKAQFMAHFTLQLVTHQAIKTTTSTSVEKPSDTTPSPSKKNITFFDKNDSDSGSDVEDIDMTKTFISLSSNH